MKDVLMVRHISDVVKGTRGTLSLEGLKLSTIERAWLDNRPYVSCIPSGEYIITPHNSPTFGAVYSVVGGTVSKWVSDHSVRSAVLLHPANYADQLEGCIALGRSEGTRASDGAWAVWNSANALTELREALGEGPHRLTIRWGVQV